MKYNIEDIKNSISKVLIYSQEWTQKELNLDNLLKDWANNKADLADRFLDGELIKNFGEITCHLDAKTRDQYYEDFYHCGLPRELKDFLDLNKEGFYSNEVVCNEGFLQIPVGMKLSRAFKFFISDKDYLDAIQTKYSTIRQKDCLTGELCVSVHPLDFLSSSENNYNWRSCHALDGEYRAGNLSYIADGSTMISYIKGIEGNVKLPHFPNSVLWNNKKWRCLLFFSEDRNSIMAGRQYPMLLPTSLDVLSEDLGIADWTKWSDHYIDYNVSSHTWMRRHVLIDNYYNIYKAVQDKGLHYDDLLNSSCYIPKYSYKKGKYLNTMPSWKVGRDVICPICGENYLRDTSYMGCDSCDSNNTQCYECGDRISLDEVIITYNGDSICPYCYDNYYFTCEHCGEVYHNDYAYRHDDGYETYLYCEDCYREVVNEE